MPRLRWLCFYSFVFFVIAVTVTTFFLEMERMEELSATLDARMNTLVKLTRENQTLHDKIDYYSTTAGIARLAREEFNLVRPGEKIYRLEIVSSDRLIN